MNKLIIVFISMFLIALKPIHAQQKPDNKKEIKEIIDQYSESVIKRDSVAFYNLFNEDNVTWCAALMENSQNKEIQKKGKDKAGSSYFSGSYQGFLRGLYRYKSTEDKFDNIHIIEDGTVASVTMDYSFWADNKMTNWGSKYLNLIKKEGKWKITSVIFSLELTSYFEQPSITEREKDKKSRL